MKTSYELRTKYNLDNILKMAECPKEIPNYNGYKEQLKALINKHGEDIQPLGYALTTIIDNKKTLVCMITLGEKIDRIISDYFANHEYLEGMMMNAFGDEVLYEATNHLYDILKASYKEENLFLSRRVEPGTSDTDISMQRRIYDIIVPEFQLSLGITEGFMLSPAKTLAYYYNLTNEDCSLGIDHDCSMCDSIKCKQRKYIIEINKDKKTELIQARNGENLLDVLRSQQIYMEAPCSGMGKCGKCKVKALGHRYQLTDKEKETFSSTQQEEGYILACFHTIDQNLKLYLEDEASHLEIESDYRAFEVKRAKYDAAKYKNENARLGIGVDIGTTTLAIALVNRVTQEVIAIKKKINPQKAYGSDIISRIMYVGEYKDQVLSQIIGASIQEMSLELISENDFSESSIEEMVISGNTTMIYLLLGIDPQALAVAPFTTIDMGMKECDSKDLFDKMNSFKVTILPWISAYVGGDIVSGLYANHIIDQEQNLIFVDIGTNGEIVLKTKDHFISAATAAGPAFEGANIKYGVGSVSGAICEIEEDGDSYKIKTLKDSVPTGICGSALIDAVAIMLKQGHIDAMGYMEKEVRLHGDIGIYPADIRQVQLAKAAIYAGVKVLLDFAGIGLEDIGVFYIAGGFGSHLNVENSAYIGLIPSEVVSKVLVVGNGSLAGSVRYLCEKDGAREIEALRRAIQYEELCMSAKFNEAYVEAMMFDV